MIKISDYFVHHPYHMFQISEVLWNTFSKLPSIVIKRRFKRLEPPTVLEKVIDFVKFALFCGPRVDFVGLVMFLFEIEKYTNKNSPNEFQIIMDVIVINSLRCFFFYWRHLLLILKSPHIFISPCARRFWPTHVLYFLAQRLRVSTAIKSGVPFQSSIRQPIVVL